jgi:hypothetical protein
MNKLLLIACTLGCGKPDEDYKKQKPPEPEATNSAAATKEAPPAPAKKALTEAELGTCELEATGAMTFKQTSPGGRPATNVSYWMSEAERGNMNIDGFVVNCQGKDARFSILPGGGKKDGMPFAPKKYTFKKGTGDANVMVTFGPKVTLGDPNGTVDITTFDKKRIVGTIDLSGKLVPGGGNVKLTGKFDLACPGFANCEQ